MDEGTRREHAARAGGEAVDDPTAALRNALGELERLNRVMRTMNSTLDLDQVLDLFIAELEASFEFEGIAVLLLSEDRTRLRTRKLRIPGMSPERLAEIIRETEAIPLDLERGGGVAAAVLTRRVYFFNEIDPATLAPGPNRDAVVNTGLRSVLLMPLLVRDEAIGVVMMSGYRRALDFDEAELESIRRFVDQICQAVKNGKMHEELLLAEERLRRKTEELEAANRSLEEQKRLLEQLSRTDDLTGLRNRRWFFERAAEELHRCRRFGSRLFVFMIDLDGFKAVNDTHGHARGDAVLVELARVLEAVIRRSDLLARYGGEEFVLASVDNTDEGAAALAERIRRSVAAHQFREGGPPLRMTVSVGYSRFPAPEGAQGSVDALVREADQALYAAKASGKDRCVCRHDTDLARS